MVRLRPTMTTVSWRRHVTRDPTGGESEGVVWDNKAVQTPRPFTPSLLRRRYYHPNRQKIDIRKIESRGGGAQDPKDGRKTAYTNKNTETS